MVAPCIARCQPLRGTRRPTHEHRRSQFRHRHRREPVHPARPHRQRHLHHQRQLLAHHLLAGRTGPRALRQERTDRQPLAHLFRQHRHGALAADDRAGHAQRRAVGHVDSRHRCRVQQDRRPALFLDRADRDARRGRHAHLVRHRRSAPHPHPAQFGRAPLRRVHGAGPGTGSAPDTQRRRRHRQPWKREREGRPFSTSALAFSESWTDAGRRLSPGSQEAGRPAPEARLSKPTDTREGR